jgi:hypothetical protein
VNGGLASSAEALPASRLRGTFDSSTMNYEVQNWIAALSQQRNEKTGCIPWSYEWMLRYKGASVDFTTFQQEFDLQAKGKEANHFSNVAREISGRYPGVEFKWQGFPKGKGNEKIQELEKRVTAGTLCAYSLAMIFRGEHDGWHIMPVVALDDDHVTMVYAFHQASGKAVLFKLPKSFLIDVHDRVPGGDDFAWIEKW